jgi:BirA family transcriptional regulator, biotin operon repressor / biotin---[acetyl-CoA-carboxylase] ligase
MALTPGDWGIEALWQALQPVSPGLSVELVEEIGSTNVALVERLRKLASQPASLDPQALAPTLLVAMRQTQGRGRLGRSWVSAPHSALTCSLSLPIARADWSGLSLAVGLALAQALDPAGTELGLKWPNDLWRLDARCVGRKLGGVLIEALTVGSTRMAVIGIGLNVQPQALDLPTGALEEFWPEATPPAVLARVMPALLRALANFEQAGFAGVADDYARRDLLQGRWLSTTDPACPAGESLGVAADGALRLLAQGVEHRVVSGEISVRPTLTPDQG